MSIKTLTTTNNNIIKGIINALRTETEPLISLDKFVVQVLETTMDIERKSYLANLLKNGVRDKGNGHYERSLKSLSRNRLTINIPRTRVSDFKPMVLEILKYNQEQINMAPANISRLASHFHEARAAWENSILESTYKVIFCDALYITLRRGNSYSKEAEKTRLSRRA